MQRNSRSPSRDSARSKSQSSRKSDRGPSRARFQPLIFARKYRSRSMGRRPFENESRKNIPSGLRRRRFHRSRSMHDACTMRAHRFHSISTRLRYDVRADYAIPRLRDYAITRLRARRLRRFRRFRDFFLDLLRHSTRRLLS